MRIRSAEDLMFPRGIGMTKYHGGHLLLQTVDGHFLIVSKHSRHRMHKQRKLPTYL